MARGYRNFLVRKVVWESHSKRFMVTKWKVLRVYKDSESRRQEFSVLLFDMAELRVPVPLAVRELI
jgi:hypothetical protein